MIDFEFVFNSAPAPYLLLRADAPDDYAIAAVNEAYLRATDTLRDAIVGRGLFEGFPDNPDDGRESSVGDLRFRSTGSAATARGT